MTASVRFDHGNADYTIVLGSIVAGPMTDPIVPQPDAADLPADVHDGEAGQTSADADDGSATHEEHA